MNSDANPPPASEANITRDQASDGAIDDYDDAAHARSITIPNGGKLLVTIGAGQLLLQADQAQFKIGDAQITLKADQAEILIGGSKLTVEDGTITLDADSVLLGPEGDRQPVARVGDSVNVGTGKIVSGSDAVTSS